jgi:SAM-dependent MidA family methyltransferase
LRQVQRATLAGLPAELTGLVEWLATPPKEPFSGVIVANEVADALPVSIFEVTAQGLRERCVQPGQTRLEWTLAKPRPRLQAAFARLAQDLDSPVSEGYVSEICLDLPGWLETVTRPLQKGAVLLFDYGYPRREYYLPERSSGTLVCHYRHRAHFDPFVWPGLTDISAFVDFSALAAGGVRCGLELAGFTTQADFLLAMGAHEMIERQNHERERLRLAGELKRLILPGEMGEKFKLLALTRALECELGGLTEADHSNRL